MMWIAHLCPEPTDFYKTGDTKVNIKHCFAENFSLALLHTCHMGRRWHTSDFYLDVIDI